MKRLVLALCALLPALPAAAAPHAESCLHDSWGFLTFQDNGYAAQNACGYAVTVWFLAREGAPIEATVKARGIFKTGLKRTETFNGADWIAAVCPQNRVPKPEFTRANWDTILKSKYDCVRK